MDNESKAELKKLLFEIEVLYERIVNTVVPFYGISHDRRITEIFGEKYRIFIEYYFRKKDYNCDKVAEAFKNFIKTQEHVQQTSWLDRIRRRERMTKRRLKELKRLVEDWYASDIKVKESLMKFDDSFNNGLENIQKLITSGKTEEARAHLNDFVNDSKRYLYRILGLIEELEKESTKLKSKA